ncbi:ATP-binding protein [Actinoplanes sp. NPDC051851]|uniref:sensor histidine kinase n=1 Tax=Actinoplanes sp. NPDC051851 TaxID=3154753 RepID=UPI003428D36B
MDQPGAPAAQAGTLAAGHDAAERVPAGQSADSRADGRAGGAGGSLAPGSDAVLALMSEAYVAVGAGGEVVGWNPAARKTFGWAREQVIGRDVFGLIAPERFRAAYRASLRRLGNGDAGGALGRRMQLTALHRDGFELPVELMLTATGTGTDQVVHALAHDVTAALRSGRFTMVEAAISGGLAGAPSSADAATRVVEALGLRMGWPVAELWLHDEHRGILTCAARHNRSGRDLTGFAIEESAPGTGLPGVVYHEARAVWVPDLAADGVSPVSRAGARAGLRVAVGVPICSGDRVLGALCVYGDRAEDPEDTLIDLLTGVADRVGQYLERRHSEELAIDLARTKDEFLALVTHELRNPLAVIVGAITLLDEELAELSLDELRDQLRIISGCTDRLNILVNDLLDLASLESGNLDIKTETVDLCAVLAESIVTANVTAGAKDLTVRAVLPPQLMLSGDPDRLRQVADNLLSNAVKYTPPGGTVTVTAALDRADPGWLTWTVADTGIGIPVEERPRLFRRFYRASTAVTARIPGTGLGLVITRTIIERHHGTITIADGTGPGTTFAIRLPRGAAAAGMYPVGRAPAARTGVPRTVSGAIRGS